MTFQFTFLHAINTSCA